MRALSSEEQAKLKVLTQNQVEFTLIEPTETALRKSIMDATGSVRSYLKASGVHDYEGQGQGPKHKRTLRAVIHTASKMVPGYASLYRPKTKKGDPRIWFSRLASYANPNDILTVIAYEGELHAFNLTRLPVIEMLGPDANNSLQELVAAISNEANAVALELLQRLRQIVAYGPVRALLDADTAVGRTLEHALGISMNSSKLPDYKGIELKSFRGARNNRKNLFAQVPDWSISKFKSSAEILDAFGYEREEDFKLYCTVSAIKRNSQGLILRIDGDIQQLLENADRNGIGDFVVWKLEDLHRRLLSKHRETFWVKAEAVKLDGVLHFHYTEVEHTRKPIPAQFDLLLEQGLITVDHLIKRNAKGRVVEKGPLFKINSSSIGLLFPPSERYRLIVG